MSSVIGVGHGWCQVADFLRGGQPCPPVSNAGIEARTEDIRVNSGKNERCKSIPEESCIVSGVLHSANDCEFPMSRRGGGHLTAGSTDLAILNITQTAKISRQVVEADSEQIHPVNGCDCICILDTVAALQKDLHHGRTIDHGVELCGRYPRKLVVRQKSYLGPLTARRESGGIYDPLCLRDRLHPRCDDPASTAVQYAPYNTILSLGCAHPRFQTEIMCRRGDLHRALDWHAAVLEVDPDYPVAGGAGHPRDVSRTRMAHAECQDCLSSRQPADDSQWCLSLHADMVPLAASARQFNFREQ
jgi:hypothetical protein